MEYSVNENAGRLVIAMKGQLTYTDAAKFDGVLSHLRKGALSTIEFDLGGLDFVDSTGMSLFIHAYDASQKYDYSITVRGAKEGVKSALTKAGFDNLFAVR